MQASLQSGRVTIQEADTFCLPPGAEGTGGGQEKSGLKLIPGRGQRSWWVSWTRGKLTVWRNLFSLDRGQSEGHLESHPLGSPSCVRQWTVRTPEDCRSL